MKLSPLPSGYKLVEPKTAKQLDSYYQLRWEVLRREWHRPKGSEKDDGEENAFHAMILNDKAEAIAVCRLQKATETEGQIRSMGVKEAYRSKGFGALIIAHLETVAKQFGLQKIFLHARENAIPFYEKMGYQVIEKSYLLFDVIQHYKMEKQLIE